ncbi:hypothetical protein [Aquibium microcysteis]|uniref:hypothetical protein n=1 Tax=Aquibium microcysteis TaxID=675281 RepID=UPI00165D1DDE|nr:hypothetical protein [Aquibium microcysteis]
MEFDMRMLLLVAVIALGVDAVKFDGAYSQTAWREISTQFAKLQARVDDGDLLDRKVTVERTANVSN